MDPFVGDPLYCFPEMMCQFYANIRQSSSPFELISRVNFVEILLALDLVNQIFNTKIEEECRTKLENFFSYEEIPTSVNHFDGSKLMKYIQTSFTAPNQTDLSELDSLQQILFTMVSNLLVPTDDHHTDANNMELYLFYYFMEKIRFDFGFIIYHLMNKIKTNARGKLSYAKFITPVFKHFSITFISELSKENSTHFFTKSYFEHKNVKFFDGVWVHKKVATETRSKHALIPFLIHILLVCIIGLSLDLPPCKPLLIFPYLTKW